MKNYISLLSLLLINSLLYAGEGDYAVSKIPVALLKNANVVKRMEEIRFEVLSVNKAKYYKKYALTILNENGDKYGVFFGQYDKMRSIESVAGTLYDAEGRKIKSLKKNDLQDYSGVSDISLMDDNRIKFHSFYYKVYPYSIEYEVEITYNNTYIFPVWMPQPAELFSVEKSSISIVCPPDFTFRYQAFRYNAEPAVSTIKNGKAYAWQTSNLVAITKEYALPEWATLTTCIFFSPDKFKIDDYYGDLSSWQNFGKFIYQLNQGKDKLPEGVKQTVHQLTNDLADPKEKIIALYEYLQKNTRYVSIQFGIGGLQPFDASYVASKSYGDCKALSNYMYSLLKEINIKSFYTLIKAGQGEKYFMPDFPSDQFNHIILCIPLEKDTVWLECTSQIKAAGYMGDFTDDRYALIVDETGGKLVRTPKYGVKENLQSRTIIAKLDETGVLSANINTKYSGMQQDDLHMLINNLSKDKVKEYLDGQLDFATYTVNSFDYKEIKSALPSINETLVVTVDHYATISGKRLFITPNIMSRTNRKLKTEEERKFDIILDFGYTDMDKVEIGIPAGYKPESIPAGVAIESKFGKYKSSVQLSENKIIYDRSLEHYSGKFPKTDYSDLVKFYDAIFKADRNKIVLVKNEEEKKPF